MDSFVAFDLETTGLDTRTCEITEVGAIRFQIGERAGEEFHSLACPIGDIPVDIQRKTGISPSLVKGAPPPGDVVRAFLEWLNEDDVLIAHNAKFDAAHLVRACEREGLPVPAHQIIDTYSWSRSRVKGIRNFSLGFVAMRLGVQHNDAHRAMGDARAVRGIFEEIATGYKNQKLGIEKRKKAFSEVAKEYRNPGRATDRQAAYLRNIGYSESTIVTLSQAEASRLLTQHEEGDEEPYHIRLSRVPKPKPQAPAGCSIITATIIGIFCVVMFFLALGALINP